ncbi:MAG: sugar ABC transporter substrate-binding protein, partial [bacterium]
MRKFLILSLIVLFSISLVGCAKPKEEPGKVVVQMWVMPNSLEPITDIENLLKEFEAANPGIKVKVTSVDWGAAWTKITTAATSGDVPDLVQIGSTWVGSISGMGSLLDMKDRVSELGGKDIFVPSSWKTSGLEGSGQVTAIPWFMDARAMFYRTDVLREAGVDPKELGEWKSFERALKKIKDAKVSIDGIDISPLGMSGKNDWNVIHNLAPWMWGAGGDFISANRKTSIINSKESLNGISYYIGLVKSGYVPIEYLELNTAQVSSNFNNGSCAIYFDGPYEVKTLTTPPGQGGAAGSLTSRNFAVLPYPKGPKGRFTFVGGSNLGIFKLSKHPDESFKVIQYLTSKKSQINYAKSTGFLPARRDAFDDPFFSSDPNRRIFKEALLYGRTYPCIPAWGLLEPVLTRRFGIMWEYVTNTFEDGYKQSEIKKQLDLAKIEINGVL